MDENMLNWLFGDSFANEEVLEKHGKAKVEEEGQDTYGGQLYKQTSEVYT